MSEQIHSIKIPCSIIFASVLLAFFVDIKLLNSIIVAVAPFLNGVMSTLYILVIALLFIVGWIFQYNRLKFNASQTIVMSTCCFYYLFTDLLIGEPSVKLSFFLTFTVAAFLLPSIVKYDPKILIRSIFIIPSFGVIFSQQLYANEILEFGTITMGLSYALQIPVLASIIYLSYYFFDDRWSVKILLLPFIGCNMVYLFQMIAFGSRGPILSIFVAIIFSLLIKVRQNKRIKVNYSRLIIFMAIFIFVALSFVPILELFSSKLAESGLQFNFIEKIIKLDSAGDISNGRDKLTDITLSGIFDNPLFGHGIAQFDNNTGYVYPHNFLLQMLYDGGIVLTILILFPLLLKVKSKLKNVSKDEFIWLYYLLFCSVPGALFSGDLWNSNLLWLFFGTILSGTKSQSQSHVRYSKNYE